MSGRLLLAALLLAVLGAAEAISCADITPVANLTKYPVRRKWAAVEVAWFKDGAVVGPPGPLKPSCVQLEFDYERRGLHFMKTTLYLNEDEAVIRVEHLKRHDQDVAIWRQISQVPERHNRTFMVLAANDRRYLVLLRCSPDLAPEQLTIFSRRSSPPDDSSLEQRGEASKLLTPPAEVAALREDAARVLGVDLITSTFDFFNCYTSISYM